MNWPLLKELSVDLLALASSSIIEGSPDIIESTLVVARVFTFPLSPGFDGTVYSSSEAVVKVYKAYLKVGPALSSGSWTLWFRGSRVLRFLVKLRPVINPLGSRLGFLGLNLFGFEFLIKALFIMDLGIIS